MKQMLQRLYRSLVKNVQLDAEDGDTKMTAEIRLEDYFVILGLIKHLIKEEGESD